MNTITNSKQEVENILTLALLLLKNTSYSGDIISLNVSKGSIPEVRIVIGNFATPKMIYTNAIFTVQNGLIFK